MKIKRYTAATMREAMNLVRREHGDEAVILSTKDLPHGGVEVMAALDPEIEEYRQSTMEPDSFAAGMVSTSQGYIAPNPAANPTQPVSRSIQAYQSLNPLSAQSASTASESSFHRPVETVSTPSSAEVAPNKYHFEQKEEMHRMASELKAMRDLLENQMAGLAWGQLEHSAPQQIDLIKRLLSIGIGWELSQKLVSQVAYQESSAWSDLLKRIEDSIDVDSKDIFETGGIYALVGPTGVGKTTTIAKIASRFVMRHHPNDLALISTDSYKVGAQAQLKIFADLLNVPVHVASTKEELYALLSSFASKKLVLIDTAGMSQKAIQLSQQLTSGEHGGVPIQNYLVMSATSSLSVMQQVVEAFSQVNLAGCMLTKLDEATTLGNILTILVEQELPISYISNGQRVPEDIEMIRARNLLDQAIVLGQQNRKTLDEQAFRLGIAKEITNAQ